MLRCCSEFVDRKVEQIYQNTLPFWDSRVINRGDKKKLKRSTGS